MARFSYLFVALAAIAGGALLYVGSTTAAVPSKVFNGNTYYAVDGNNPLMDTGKEVCASMKMACLGYKSIGTNAICKLFHPTAKELVSVNGSKAGFYCNGAPQKGLACEKFKNTCQVCPNCNLNEAATCDQPIGQHFREMYVWCGAMTSSPPYGGLPLPRSSSVARTSSSPASNSVTCTFTQKPLKRVTCAAYKAADTYCTTVMQSRFAKALSCSDTGNVVCTLPCTAQGASNLKTCAYGGVKTGGCSSSRAAPVQGKGAAGALCQHGGDCKSGWCLGVVPGREYRCSCIDPTNKWQGCRK